MSTTLDISARTAPIPVAPIPVAPIPVALNHAAAPFRRPFDVYNRLTETLGEDDVFIVESLSGPARDNRSALLGYGKLLTIEVRRNRVTLSGQDAVTAIVWRQLAARHRSDGGAFVLASLADVWPLLRQIQDCFAVPENASEGFAFGFFGYFGYDTAHYVEDLPYTIPPTGDVPDISLSVFQGVIRHDLVRQTCALISASAPAWDSVAPQRVLALIEACPNIADPDMSEQSSPNPDILDQAAPTVPAPKRISDSTTRERYLDDVATALQYIAIGDIYQVQIGHELSIETEATPAEVYARLRARNPAPYMYLARFGEVAVIGASPEVFVRIDDGKITMRPLAGTVPRSGDPAIDQARSDAMLSDPKEVAEHIMLVDLCRNDIGRICEPGTLGVDELMAPEAYSHVIHMVSNVTGAKQARYDPYDVIAATFPAGTMTGAPKIRAMEIIEELETARRGIYAGAVGMIDFGGFTNLALCIRSTLHANGVYRIRASAGVVADSIAEKEWRETLAKMGSSYWAITGAEIQP
ncbi:MAG: anthranilate synthase component I family protein [Proteobacteria bacterium]|nr:anthranilate synthase component I family protein [Pseudomonadota bacterium]